MLRGYSENLFRRAAWPLGARPAESQERSRQRASAGFQRECTTSQTEGFRYLREKRHRRGEYTGEIRRYDIWCDEIKAAKNRWSYVGSFRVSLGGAQSEAPKFRCLLALHPRGIAGLCRVAAGYLQGFDLFFFSGALCRLGRLGFVAQGRGLAGSVTLSQMGRLGTR